MNMPITVNNLRKLLPILASLTWFWGLVAIFNVLLLGSALFYQYALKSYPCELCIYVRVWIVAIALLAVVAMSIKHWRWCRIAVCLAAIALTLGLAVETWNLLVVEYAIGDGGQCSMFANFPSWAPLDKWLPVVFEVQGFCAATPEIIFGITMAHSLVLTCLGLLSVFSVALIGAIKNK